jgi:hypothetical protein
VVSFRSRPLYLQGKSPQYPLDRRLGGPQSQSGHGAEEKNSQSPSGIEPRSSDRPARSQSLYRLSYLGSQRKIHGWKIRTAKNHVGFISSFKCIIMVNFVKSYLNIVRLRFISARHFLYFNKMLLQDVLKPYPIHLTGFLPLIECEVPVKKTDHFFRYLPL